MLEWCGALMKMVTYLFTREMIYVIIVSFVMIHTMMKEMRKYRGMIEIVVAVVMRLATMNMATRQGIVIFMVVIMTKSS